MPILVEQDTRRPLDQGDLLHLISLCWANTDGSCVGEQGMGLVISRPCVAVRRSLVQVAVVKATKLEVSTLLKDGASLERVRRRMFAVRDGDGTPDVFYLGPLPGKDPRRFAARLDHVVTIAVPEEATARAEWVALRRVARLDPAFRRDLHVRLFTAIARQGFDDLGWYTDEDLDLLVKHGRSLVSKAQAELEALQAEADAARADGENSKADNMHKKNIPSAQSAVDEQRRELAPFEEELARREPQDAATEPPEERARFRISSQE